MVKLTKKYAVYNQSDEYYEYYDSMKDAITSHYSSIDGEPVEVFECTMKSIGEYEVVRSVKVKKVKETKGKK